jgi:hypothetical protein
VLRSERMGMCGLGKYMAVDAVTRPT